MKVIGKSTNIKFTHKGSVAGIENPDRAWRGFFFILVVISFIAIIFGKSSLFWTLLALVLISIPIWRILKKFKMTAETTVVQAELWDSERIQNMTKLILGVCFVLGFWVLKLIGFKLNLVTTIIIGGIMGFFTGKKLVIAGLLSDKKILRLDKFTRYSDFLEKAFP